jgi:DNA primase
MGKISPVSIKYIIRANLELTGVADRPDIIGAVFGQTEGLLGADLELRELQKSGRIGRIDVKIETRGGRTNGEILLPSSMGKAETAIIGASLETIERVGPCDAKIKVTKIEDVRVSKRNMIIDRAKQLLSAMMTDMPDSQALTQLITEDVRTLEVVEYGRDRLPAGPDIDNSEEIIVVEGRADVLNLLRYGFKNVIAVKGAKAPETVVELSKKKSIIIFTDGDRGGDLIIRGLVDAGTEIDFVARAPDGKEVEELAMKEIHKALRAKIAWEQVRAELKSGASIVDIVKPASMSDSEIAEDVPQTAEPARAAPSSGSNNGDLKALKPMADELVGTRGAFLLDEKLSVLGRVPIREVEDTLKTMDGVFAVVMDGTADTRIVRMAEQKDVKYIIAPSATGKGKNVRIMKADEL